MARRGRKRKLKLKIRKDSLQSSVAILLVLSSVVIIISFLAPNYTVNAKIKEFVSGIFGISSLLLPFVLALCGLLYSRAVKWKVVELRVVFGMVGLLLGSSSLFSLLGMDGGRVGGWIYLTLESAMSKPGAAVLFAAVIAVSLIFVFDLSVVEVKEGSVKFFEKLKSNFSGIGVRRKDETADTEGEVDEDSAWGDEKEKRDEIPEPSFEIVPSVSEPKSDIEPRSVGGSDVASLAPGLPYSDRVWEPPPKDLLIDPPNVPVDRGDVKSRAKIIVDTLQSFGVEAKVSEVNFGPSVTQYALEAASGTRIARVSGLQHDLALALASPTGSVRIEAPIPGKSLIGIEVPNNSRVSVRFKEVLTSDAMKGMKSKLGVVLGKDVGGQVKVCDIGRMPHFLVAGSTGSGKSVFLHSVIFSLLYRCSPQECKFIFVDPKRVELVHYADIPNLLTPVVTDIERAASVFMWAVQEMERRYKLLESAKARNIDSYNEKSGFQALPYIVIVVDELSDIMVADPARVEKSIIRLAQLARATGIHLILTVQRPSTNVITGLIKANIPCRIAFNVTSQIDSRVIIDQPGAEKLLGKGDMLFVPPDVSKPIRIQGAMVEDKEISQLVSYLKSVGPVPEYKEDIFKVKRQDRSVSAGGGAKDSLFNEAIDVVTSAGKASASLLQRRLSIGYARAARILDELEVEGRIGPARGSKPREVLAAEASGDVSDQEEDVYVS